LRQAYATGRINRVTKRLCIDQGERVRTQHRNSVFGPSFIGVLQTVFLDLESIPLSLGLSVVQQAKFK